MKKILTLAAALLVVAASSAMAQGLNLSWGNCGTAGTSTVAINCNSNAGALLVANASVFPQVPMNTFAAATCVIDVKVNGGTLPPWWQTNTGQCRANSIGMSFDPNNNVSDCVDIWAGNPNLQVTAIQQGVWGADWVRLNGVAAIPAGSEIPLATGTELWVCRITINKANTLTCAGCSQPAQIVLNEIAMQDPNQPQQRVTNPGDNACIGLSGGQPLCAGGATPAQNRTWGAVKNLYR
jgi:hypothetical protein